MRIDTIVLSTQHGPEVSQTQLHADIKKHVILPIAGELIDADTIFHINPTGTFVIGGPHGDTGLTGRKIIVDTYGGVGRHGGGAFSGKDPTKVDRSAAYMARYLAKRIVAEGRASRCEVQLSYAIGVAQPVSVHVETFGTEQRSTKEIEQRIKKSFDLSPAGIIAFLHLKQPIYQKTASYGHFGRNDVSWEQVLA